MCIIFYNEEGHPYNHEQLSVAYDNNPHGLGLMWVENDGVHTIRGLLSKEEMFELLEEFVDTPHVLHLRWRTRGKVNPSMCHPFPVVQEKNNNVWMMHNGTFLFIDKSKNVSDTKIFAGSLQKITDSYGVDILFEETFVRKLEKEIESFNKIILLRDDGAVSMFNPDQWFVHNGIWHSNVYSLEPGYRSTQKKLKKKKVAWNEVLDNNTYSKRSKKVGKKKRKKREKVMRRNYNGVEVEVRL